MRKSNKSPFSFDADISLSGLKFPDASKQFSLESWTFGVSPLPSLNDETINEEVGSRKVGLIMAVIILVFASLFARLAYLQLNQGGRFAGLAEGNRIRNQVIYAQRGTIYDRNGVVLARNSASFQLVANPYQLEDDALDRTEDYRAIASVLDTTYEEIMSKAEQQGLDYVLPITIKSKISHEQSIVLDQVLPSTTGFSLDEVPTRNYVDDAGLSHVLGYVGQVSPEDLEQNDKLSLVDFIGREGIEQQYDDILRGSNGFKQHEVDSFGHPVRLLAEKSSKNGNDIYLTIDYEVQKALYKSMKKFAKKEGNRRGAGVALDPDTGEVLAMVSLPAYDNNLFSGGIAKSQYDKLNNNKLLPTFNRAVTGVYPIGSTAKPMVASAALEHGVVKPKEIIVDKGSLSLGTVKFSNFEGKAHGPINIVDGIAKSSNVFFYTMGGRLKEDRLASNYRMFGLGSPTGIDLQNEVPGIVPDNEWKLEVTGEPWYPGDNYNVAIGQGDLRATPLQLSVANSAVANGGKILEPRIFLRSSDGQSSEEKVRSRINIKSKNISLVREGMRQAGLRGTVCQCHFNTPVPIAGKTGTAETSQSKDDVAHAWFYGFAPFKDPEIAVLVLLEKGKSSSFAVQASAPAFEAYFD